MRPLAFAPLPDFAEPLLFYPHQGGLLQIPYMMSPTGLRLHRDRANNLLKRISDTNCGFCGHQYELATGGIAQQFTPAVKAVYACIHCGNWKALSGTALSGVEWLMPFIRSFEVWPHITQLVRLAEVLDDGYAMPRNNMGEFISCVHAAFADIPASAIEYIATSLDGTRHLLFIDLPSPLMLQLSSHTESPSKVQLGVVTRLFASLLGQPGTAILYPTINFVSPLFEEWIHFPRLHDSSYFVPLDRFRTCLERTPQRIPRQPGWLIAADFWNRINPFSRLADQLISNIAVPSELEIQFSSIDPSSAPRSDVLPKPICRHHEGWLINTLVGSILEWIFISDYVRNRCWLVSNIHDWKGVGRENPPCDSWNTLCGDEFLRVLSVLPIDQIDCISYSWRITTGEDVVTMEW